MKQYIIDGSKITDVLSLCDVFANAVNAPNDYFGKDFHSFGDCLFGGMPMENILENSLITFQCWQDLERRI